MRELRPPLTVLVILFAFFLINDFRTNSWLWVALLTVALWAASNLTIPLLFFSRVSGYLPKLEASQRAQADAQRNVAVQFLAKARGLEGVWIVWVLALALSFTAGHSQASRSRHFFVIAQRPEWVVLRIYGARAVTAELLRKEKGFRPNYRVFNIDASDAVFRMEDLGPLAPLPQVVNPPSIGPSAPTQP